MEAIEIERKIKLENYYGPLDLLLHLVKEEELDVLNIPIERVVKQYLEFLEIAKTLEIDVAGEFLVMASQLLLIKSRKVVPEIQVEGEEEEKEGVAPAGGAQMQLF